MVDYLDLIGSILTWSMAVFMFIIAISSFFKALGYLKKSKKMKKAKRTKKVRIPTQRRVVTVTVLWGVIVSVLNLASIGNTQTLTMMYLIKSWLMPFQSITMMFVYGISFVLPSVGIFLICAAATGNEWFQSFTARHKSLVKFLLSIMWCFLFLKFIQFSVLSKLLGLAIYNF